MSEIPQYNEEQRAKILAEKIRHEKDFTASLNAGETKTHKTLTLTISHWALIEQIRTSRGLKNAEQSIIYSIKNTAQELGIETG